MGREDRSPKRKSPVQDPLSLPPTTESTTLPYQLPPTTKSFHLNIPGLPQAYTSANMMPTFSNLTPSLVRPNALRHHNPSTAFTSAPNTTAFTTASDLTPTTASNPFLQSSGPYQTMSSTSAFPSYSYRQASVNGPVATTMTTNSAAKAPQRINLQKVFLPQQLGQNSIVQNGNGQYILWPPTATAKDAAKRSPSGEASQKEGERSVPRTMAEAVTSTNFYPGANNMFTFQTTPGNPSQVYAQVSSTAIL